MSTTGIALSSLIFSTVSCFFVNSWLTVWILLEINTLSFCSLSFKKMSSEKTQTKEMLMKYLIVQSIASALLILGSSLKESEKFPHGILLTMIVTMSLMIKMAAAPFHSWFISVSKKSAWLNNILLFTWQKLLPVYLILFQPKSLAFPFILASSWVGSIFLMNKKALKEIMAFSSVFNLSWMLAAILLSLKIMLLFSLIYWVSVITFIKTLTKNKTQFMSEKKSNTNKALTFISTINLAAIPPLMFFMVKWVTLSQMLTMKMALLSTFLLVMSSINIFIYLRMTSSNLLKMTTEEQKAKKQESKVATASFVFLNIVSLHLFL